MQKTDHDESEVAVEDKDGQQHAEEAERPSRHHRLMRLKQRPRFSRPSSGCG